MELLKENEKLSLMRFIAFVGVVIGVLIVVNGFFVCWIISVPDGLSYIVSGLAAIATAQGFKMGQKFAEKNERTN